MYKRELLHIMSKFNRKTNVQNVVIVEKIEEDNMVKKVATYIEDTDFKFWVSKEPLPHYQTSVDINDVKEVRCKYSNLFKTIAKLSNKQGFYVKCVESNNESKLRQLYNNKDIHYADVNLLDYNIAEYNRKHKENLTSFPLHKAYFDIEVDASLIEGFPKPEEALCPINFISYVDAKSKSLVLYILLNDKNSSQQKFIETNKGTCTNLWHDRNNEWCKKALEEYFQDEKNPKNSMDSLTIYWFRSEVSLIKKFYERVHKDRPDFLGAYNTYFDVKTIETRLRHYEIEPSKVMCPSDFPIKKVHIKEDTNSTDLDEQANTLDIAGWGHVVDLRYYYLGIRKGQGKKDSTKLGDVLLEELGEGKIELEDDIKRAVYTDFENFLLYSAFDSFRLHQLESKNMDIELIHKGATLLNTRHHKLLRKTTSLRNLAFEFFLTKGRILSNNANMFKEHESTKFKGAFVADSNKINPVGVMLGKIASSTLFDDAIDQDFTGLYPAIISTFQVGDDTLIGRILFDEKDSYLEEYYGELLNQKDPLTMGREIFNLADLSTVLENIDSLLVEE